LTAPFWKQVVEADRKGPDGPTALSRIMGPAAMVLWVALAASGVALLMKDPKQ
jgi:hypothetical protein